VNRADREFAQVFGAEALDKRGKKQEASDRYAEGWARREGATLDDMRKGYGKSVPVAPDGDGAAYDLELPVGTGRGVNEPLIGKKKKPAPPPKPKKLTRRHREIAAQVAEWNARRDLGFPIEPLEAEPTVLTNFYDGRPRTDPGHPGVSDLRYRRPPPSEWDLMADDGDTPVIHHDEVTIGEDGPETWVETMTEAEYDCYVLGIYDDLPMPELDDRALARVLGEQMIARVARLFARAAACTHCRVDPVATRKDGLCRPCKRYQRDHGGTLPPDGVIEARKMKRREDS
jgi:hypothetical protein